MLQSWNDVLSYIKLELGGATNLIEMADDEIIKNLKEHVLPYFSHYAPFKKFILITDLDRIYSNKLGQPQFRYKLKLDLDEHVIDIDDVYFTRQSILSDDYGMTAFNHFGAMDVVMANTYIDAIKSIGVRNTWEFIPPNVIMTDQEITSAIVAYYTLHKDLSSIPPDLYSLIFKKLCLGKVMVWLSAMRSKYENLATPFGQLPINWQQLKEDGQRMIEEANQQLNALPPDRLIEASL